MSRVNISPLSYVEVHSPHAYGCHQLAGIHWCWRGYSNILRLGAANKSVGMQRDRLNGLIEPCLELNYPRKHHTHKHWLKDTKKQLTDLWSFYSVACSSIGTPGLACTFKGYLSCFWYSLNFIFSSSSYNCTLSVTTNEVVSKGFA